MLRVSRKFPLRTELLSFRARAKRSSTPLLTLYYLPASGESRLGVIIPKKASRRATSRNWLRRLIYSNTWDKLKDKHQDLVIVFKPSPFSKSPAFKSQLLNDLSKVLTQL